MRYPDKEAMDYAREHLDLTRNLNDQGYYGPIPNEVHPRSQLRTPPSTPEEIKYYERVDNWIAANGGVIDGKKMHDGFRREDVEEFFSDPANKDKTYYTIW